MRSGTRSTGRCIDAAIANRVRSTNARTVAASVTSAAMSFPCPTVSASMAKYSPSSAVAARRPAPLITRRVMRSARSAAR